MPGHAACKSAKINLILRTINSIHVNVICKPSKNKSLRDRKEIFFEIFNSVNDFSRDDWNRIAGAKIFLGCDYLIALEESKPAGISFRYVIIYKNKIPAAICNFQVADLSSKELGSLINLENQGSFVSSIGNKINDLLFSQAKYASENLVVCGSLFVSGEYGIACADENFFPMAVDLLPGIIEKISEQISKEKGRVICYSVKDFYEDADNYSKKLAEEKFYRMVIDPNMIFRVRKEWRTFDDYLDAMSAKYRLRANNVVKKLGDIEIKYLERGEIEKEKESIEDLYLQVQKKAPVRIVRVNIHYFLTLKKYLKDEFIIRAFYLKGKMIAFTSGFKHRTHYEAHFIGIDYQYNKSHSLYQNILYDFIHEAIKNKAEELVFGRTAMEIKSTVGAVAYPLYSYLKFSNNFLNRIIKPFIPSGKNTNWVPRNPFKV
jgi:predicted N-acyltransferase